jgi:hypothetical protein
MMFFFSGRYGPLLRIAGGVGLVVFGLVDSSRLTIILGVVLAAWGTATGISRRIGRESNNKTGTDQGSRDRFGVGR